MTLAQRFSGQRRLAGFINLGFVVAGLYLAREVLLPFAFAIFLSFLLAPVVIRLERWGIGRIPAVIITVLILAVSLGGLGWLITDQVVQLTNNLPTYKDNLRTRIRTIVDDVGGSFTEAGSVLKELDAELKRPAAARTENEPSIANATNPQAGESSQNATTEPIPVRVVQQPSLMQSLGEFLASILGPLGMAGIVAVLVSFILLEREDIRHRAILLTAQSRLPVTTKVIDEITSKVSRYLRTQFVVNSVFGIAVGSIALLVGLPNPWFWAIAGACLRFIPFIGAWFVAGGLTAVALAMFPGWTQPVILLVSLMVLELALNNFLEPWLYGSSTGISAVGIFASAIFWTWLWGAPGLFLSTPIAVCLSAAGRHFPQLSFTTVLLSDVIPVPPQSRYYQRMLALDPSEANQLLTRACQDEGTISVFDNILLPTLRQVEHDYQAGDLELHERDYLHSALEHAAAKTSAESGDDGKDSDEELPTSDAREAVRIACIGAHGEADQVSSRMVGEFLERQGFEVLETPEPSLSAELVQHLADERPDVILISTLSEPADRHARYLYKRIRQTLPGVRLIIGSWIEHDKSPSESVRSDIEMFVAHDINELAGWLARHGLAKRGPQVALQSTSG